MNKEITIISLGRVRGDSLWRISFHLNGVSMSTLIGTNHTAIGDRLRQRLSELEKQIKGYPFQINFNEIADKNIRTARATLLEDSIGYIEINIPTFKNFHKGKIKQTINFLETPLNKEVTDEFNEDETEEPSFRVLSNEKIANSHMDYLIIGEFKKLNPYDGDTIDVEVSYISPRLKPKIKDRDNVTIRFTGVQTPETRKDGSSLEDYSDLRNVNYSQHYSIPVEGVYEIADEGKEYVRSQLEGKKIVIVLDRDAEGKLNIKYERYMGIIYVSGNNDANYIIEDIKNGKNFFNLNKSLLVQKSKKYPEAPLAYADTNYVLNGQNNTALNTMEWATELGLEVFDTGTSKEPTGIHPMHTHKELYGNSLDESASISDAVLSSDTAIKYSQEADYSLLQQIKPNDDRAKEIFNYVDGVAYEKDSRVRIGDVLLTIPPLSISVQKNSKINRIKAMRTKSSIMTNSGHTDTTLEMSLYFHDIDNINGVPMKTGDYTFYVDGLRTLIAQFAKCPFVPIDNPYINHVLNIHSVALLDLSVSTVPGFPHSLEANITLAKFDTTAYMPSTAFLGEVINYPLMRWYYQQAMFDRSGENSKTTSDGRTFYKPLTERLTNDFKFKIAESSTLEARMSAVNNLNSMDGPEKVRQQAKERTNQYGFSLSDAAAAKSILKRYEKYQEMKKEMKPHSVIDKSSQLYEFRRGFLDKYNIEPRELNEMREEGAYFFKEIYGDEVESNSNEFFAYELPYFYPDRLNQNENQTTNHYKIPREARRIVSDFSNGLIQIGLMSQSNMAMFGEAARSTDTMKGAVTYYFSATNDNIAKLKTIAEQKETVENQLDDYEENYRIIEQVVRDTENNLPLFDFEIPGLLPISLNVMYSNQFAALPVIESESSSYQYMGAQEPYVQMMFEVNDEGLTKLNELIEKVDEYARKYRQGISTGFLGLENQLTELFGIRSVMIQSAQYTTVPNYPGRNQVSMILVAFNKTQRRAEELAGFNAATQGTNLNDVRNNRSQDKSDQIVEIRLKKMEVYPDLELPTYTELNEGIKKMKIDVPEIVSLTGGLFVDPDFYVSIPWTFRKQVQDEVSLGSVLKMEDSTGVIAETNSKSEAIVDVDGDSLAILNQLASEVTQVESAFSWGDKSITPSDLNGDGVVEPVTYQSEEIATYFTEEDEKGKKKYQEAPTRDELLKWGVIDSSTKYHTFTLNPQPTEHEVWKEILTQVTNEFGSFNFIGGKKDYHQREDLKEHEQATSYKGTKALYAVNFNYILDELSKEEVKKVNERIESNEFKKPEIKKDKISEGHFYKMKYKVPFERIFATIKALFDHASKWKQFNNQNQPNIDAALNAVGIAGVPLADAAKDLETAKRLAWDWKFNIQTGVKKLAEFYSEAEKMDHVTQIEFAARPWEVMLFRYKYGRLPENDADLNDNPILASVFNIFYKKYNSTRRWATPSVTLNADIYADSMGLSTEEKKYINGEASREDYLKLLRDEFKFEFNADLLYGNYKGAWEKFVKDNKLKIVESSFDMYAGDFTEAYFEKATEGELRKLLEYAVNDLKKDLDFNKKFPIFNLFEKAWDGIRGLLGDEIATDKAEDFTESTGAAYEVLINEDDRLVGNTDAKVIYQEMYKDMIKYDHRGRLLRAFPAFQMLIIDEGKMMGRFKFWDNMYGFNSIESIDVHKSRKIAADTAVISMTNVYSNLTSKRTDNNYTYHKSDFWTNLVFENPDEELLDVRERLLNQMMLQTGARIHLRMGYGADASAMPVVFNGTITEMNTEEVIEIVVQGDGVELGNVISGDPDDDNNGFFNIVEPRDLICKLLTSKGNWFRNIMNRISEGRYFRDNPLGIMHFGIPGTVAQAGNVLVWNNEYGEAAQNIYSSNGTPSFSQWTYPEGEKRNFFSRRYWSEGEYANIMKWFNPGDEDNIIVKFYNNTVWDIVQTLAYCSTDYIAAVLPYETRSTLFFGKPYWRVADSYDSTYNWDSFTEEWTRMIDLENRKPYMQVRFYDSSQDILKNGIKASEEGLFTNVIVNYDAHQTPILSADYDIRYDKQKTQVIDAEIVARFPGLEYFTSEDQARNFGMSALRDSMKDMYKGSLLVIGDPSVKPHDLMYLNDTVSSMNGTCLVKAVTHQMSLETGFVTEIEPDAYVVNDDVVMLSLATWVASAGIGTASAFLGIKAARAAKHRMQKSKTLKQLVDWGSEGLDSLTQKGFAKILGTMDTEIELIKDYREIFEELNDLPKDAKPEVRKALIDKLDKKGEEISAKVKGLEAELKEAKANGSSKKDLKKFKESYKDMKIIAQKSKGIVGALRAGKGLAQMLMSIGTTIGKLLFTATGVGLIVGLAVTIATESLFEMYARYKEALQCVIMVPLRYRNKELTAGINGHMGMVVGDSPGKLDKLVSAVAFQEDDSDLAGQGKANWIFEFMNLVSGADREFSVSDVELAKEE